MRVILCFLLACGAGVGCGGDDDDPIDGGDADGDADGDSDADSDADSDGALDCAAADALVTDLRAATEEAERQEQWSAFVDQVRGAGGFPIRCGDEVRFFTNQPENRAVSGDFNEWAVDADPLLPIAGVYASATISLPRGEERVLYKLSRGGDTFVADPLALRFGYDEFGEHSLVQGGLERGHLERRPPMEGAGLAPRGITFYVPPGYDQGAASGYPLLVMHDGQNLFGPGGAFGSWHVEDVLDGLIDAGDVDPIVVVGIDNTPDRLDEYAPVEDEVGGETVGGGADAYGDLLVDTVLPWAADHYRVGTGWQNTAILGSSMGGLVSLYLGMTRPAAFGWAAGMSVPVGWGKLELDNETLIELLPSLGHPGVLFYLDSGGGPGAGCEDTDGDGIADDPDVASDAYCEVAQLRDTFLAEGYVPDEELFYWHEPGAQHNEAAWNARLFRPLTAFFGH